MKNIQNKALLLLGFLLALPFRTGSASELIKSKADGLYDKGLFQEALKEYEDVLKNPNQEIRNKALYRAIECEGLLFRYYEADKRAEAAPLPTDTLWRARFLILRSEIAREFLQQYGHAAPTDVDESKADISRRTPEEWRVRVREAYRNLWDLRKELIKIPLTQEKYFVDLRQADLTQTPTLWDFVVLRWSGFLLSEEKDASTTKPAALSFLGQDFSTKRSPEDSLAAQAAALFEEASHLGGAGRDAARELWKIRRLYIPFEHGGLVISASDYKGFSQAAIARLKGWMKEFSSNAGRAEAGYLAANLLNQNGRYGETVETCRNVESHWPGQLAAKRCRKLRAEIELPVLSLTAKFVPPGSREAFHLATRNLKRVHFRLYRADPEDLRSLQRQYKPEGWSTLRQVDKEAVDHFLHRSPDYVWTTEVRETAPYAYENFSVRSPELKAGIYLAMASESPSFAPGETLFSAVFINVTDLFLLTSSGPQGPEADFVFDPNGPSSRNVPMFHYYTVDALTGRPQTAHIDAFRNDHWRGWDRFGLDTGPDGRAQTSMDVRISPWENNYIQIDPLARKGESYAYPSSALYGYVSIPQPVQLFIETDRPIYRPGQEVRVKVTVLRRMPRGYKTYDGPSEVTFEARDANYQELYKTPLKLNAMGSAQTKFTVATGRMLGNYNLSAYIQEFGRGFSASHSFSVEEYKRPEFEVKINESADAWRYGQTATVKGEAKYYFGGAVPDAPVRYKVRRQVFIPWFCWYWRGLAANYGNTEILTGETKTDAQGKFSFTFVPQPQDPSQKDPWPSTFSVEIESRDPGGRTITASRSFQAGEKAYLFDIAPKTGFLSAGQKSEIPIRLMNLNGKALSGSGSYELHRLFGKPKTNEDESPWNGSFGASPSLEAIFKDVPNGPLLSRGSLAFSGDKPAPAALDALVEGVYRLVVRARDPWGGVSEQSVILLAAGGKSANKSLDLPTVTLAEHPSYVVGETARILMGSGKLDGTVFLEVWGGQNLLSRQTLDGGGIRVFSLPVAEDHKGGFTVRWFGVKDFKIRSGEVRLDVPWKDRELDVKLQHTPVMKPGEKVNWSLSVTDDRHRNVIGEAVVRVFDRSLEYYAQAMSPWVSQLFAQRWGQGSAQGSQFQPWANAFPVEKGWIAKILQLFNESINEPQSPSLRLNRGRLYYGGRGGGGRLRHMLSKNKAVDELSIAEDRAVAAPSMQALARRESNATGLAGIGESLKDEEAPRKKQKEDAAKPASAPAEPPVHVRADFSETAYFEPQLAITNGHGAFSFTAPEQLTSWKIQAYALTKDIKRGEVSAEAVTRKDLMVQVEMPRYFREGDFGTIKTVVHNETPGPLTGDLKLVIEEDGQEAAGKLGLTDLAQHFSAQPGGIAALSWKVKAPKGVASFKIRAIARSGNLVDAEERDLPILPSRERLIETTIVSLDGVMKKILRLPAFEEPDSTREHESITLQVDPQLALSILNTLPSVIHYPHECTEQLLDRYVPLSIVNSFYKKNPALAEAAKKIPKRDTITPAWDRNDPRRLMQLMETPWEEISKGRKSYWPLIDMFDDKVVHGELNDALGKLKAYQNPDGGFPWFPGGRSDSYITLLVLAGFAEAQRYNVEVPTDLVNRALNYVNNDIPKHLKPNESDLSMILYAAYVVTSYPQTMPGARIGWQMAKSWVDYADKHMEAMTQMGKAYAAYVYWRLGETEKGNLYLARALDGIRQDPIAGAYWTPEKISWFWYSDTVEKHAFILRTLLALRPKDPRIAGMVQWLLFNRKGNEWKSTKASAAAIYSLLDVLKSRGALTKGDSFKIHWGPEDLAARTEPMDWLEKPLRWTRYGGEVGPKDGTATIHKDGPGLAFASLTWIYTTEKLAKASGPGMMELERKFFLRSKKGEDYHLSPLKAGDTVHVGDQIEVQLKINTRSQFEYVHLKDPKIAGFEAENLLSGWRWDQLSRYEEQRDSLTNFFIDWLPHGEYVLRYRLRPTSAGNYRLGAAVLQSMYAPEMSAHSDGFTLKVEE